MDKEPVIVSLPQKRPLKRNDSQLAPLNDSINSTIKSNNISSYKFGTKLESTNNSIRANEDASPRLQNANLKSSLKSSILKNNLDTKDQSDSPKFLRFGFVYSIDAPLTSRNYKSPLQSPKGQLNSPNVNTTKLSPLSPNQNISEIVNIGHSYSVDPSNYDSSEFRDFINPSSPSHLTTPDIKIQSTSPLSSQKTQIVQISKSNNEIQKLNTSDNSLIVDHFSEKLTNTSPYYTKPILKKFNSTMDVIKPLPFSKLNNLPKIKRKDQLDTENTIQSLDTITQINENKELKEFREDDNWRNAINSSRKSLEYLPSDIKNKSNLKLNESKDDINEEIDDTIIRIDTLYEKSNYDRSISPELILDIKEDIKEEIVQSSRSSHSSNSSSSSSNSPWSLKNSPKTKNKPGAETSKSNSMNSFTNTILKKSNSLPALPPLLAKEKEVAQRVKYKMLSRKFIFQEYSKLNQAEKTQHEKKLESLGNFLKEDVTLNR